MIWRYMTLLSLPSSFCCPFILYEAKGRFWSFDKQRKLFNTNASTSVGLSPPKLVLCRSCNLSIIEAKWSCTVRNENIHAKDHRVNLYVTEDFNEIPSWNALTNKPTRGFAVHVSPGFWSLNFFTGWAPFLWTSCTFYFTWNLASDVVNNITLSAVIWISLPVEVQGVPKCNNSAKENSIWCETAVWRAVRACMYSLQKSRPCLTWCKYALQISFVSTVQWQRSQNLDPTLKEEASPGSTIAVFQISTGIELEV